MYCHIHGTYIPVGKSCISCDSEYFAQLYREEQERKKKKLAAANTEHANKDSDSATQ